MREAIKKASVLIEALPYIKNFHKKITVIKYGGSILAEERVRKNVLEDIAFLRYTGMRPILVHGGGPNITERLKEHKIDSNFVDGVRVTDARTLKIVEEELNALNDGIVQEIASHRIRARSFKREDNFLIVRKKKTKRDLGFVGKMVDFDIAVLQSIIAEAIPVV